MSRRQFRVAAQFFEALDGAFGQARTLEGWPSATDFLAYELPGALDRLADDYEATTLPTNELSIRVFIAAGILVPFYVLYTYLDEMDAVTVYWLTVEETIDE